MQGALLFAGILIIFIAEGQCYMPINTVDSYRNNVIRSSRPVLVFFTASWCGEECDRLKTIVNKEARLHPNVVLAEIDLDQLDTIARVNMISNVPALALFKNGKKVKSQIKYIDEYDVKYFYAWAA